MPCFVAQLCNQFGGLGWNHSMIQACSSFTDIFEFIFAGNREPDLFIAVLWALWNRRNNLRLGKPALSLGQVVEFVQDRILERNPCNVAFNSHDLIR